MICKKCGCRVSDTATFCEKCGAPMAEFGIKEETPQKKESAAIKSGKAVVERVKGDRKLQIILAVVVVLLVLGVVVGRITGKNKVFGISPNMSVAQVEKVLGNNVEIEVGDKATWVTKENVKWGNYSGTLDVAVRTGNKIFVMWSMDGTILESELMKMLEGKYGKNQMERGEDVDITEDLYKSDSGVWEVEAWASEATYGYNMEYGSVTILWIQK